MARSWASISAKARSRRTVRSARSSGSTSVAIGGIGVVGERRPAAFGDDHDLLASITTGAVLPDHRLPHQNHPGREVEVVVDLFPEIGPDHRGLGRVRAG